MKWLALGVVLALGLVWLVYGTLHPCGILGRDLRAALPAPDARDNLLQRFGRALNAAMLESMIDSAVRARTPWECLQDEVRLKLRRESPERLIVNPPR